MTINDRDQALQSSPSRGTNQAPLEELVAAMMRDRQSGTLRFEDADGEVHALAFLEGIRVTLRSTRPASGDNDLAEAPLAGGPVPSPALRAARVEQGMRLAEEIFRRSASTARITLEEAHDDVPLDAVLLDAFELLYRGVHARGKDSPLARALEGVGRRFVLHREAGVDTFPLRPEERKIVRLIDNLPRSLDDLRSRHLLPDNELVAFLHFLLITHNAFLLGDDASLLVPLGYLTPEERLLREPLPAASAVLPDSVSRYGLALFGLALIPLAVSLVSESDVPSRIEQTARAHPELAPLFERNTLTMNELLRALPGGKLEGALLTYNSATHWLCALASAVTFLGILLIVFDHGRAKIKELPLVALFTATGGSVLLLLAQSVGDVMQGVHMVPTGLVSGIAALMIYIFKFISFSYGAATDPRNGFFLSFFGFTCGVGFCEEIVKVLPVLDHFRRKGTLDMRGAIAWGLASGIGLGVAEGLMYSAQHYNGVEASLTYLVRFVSCVALHATWSATAAMAVYERRKQLQLRTNILDRATTLMSVIGIPMVLHGLYDTLLKKHLNMLALAIAIVSFGYLAVRLAKAGAVGRAAPTG